MADAAKMEAEAEPAAVAAAEPAAADFRFWDGDATPPTHSVPAHVVAKAAERIGAASFRRCHAALLRAYFTENRDISDEAELRAIWNALGFDREGFPRLEDEALVAQVFADHRQAIALGANGVPAVMREGEREVILVGAQPLETYRRWVERVLERVPLTKNGEGEI